MNTKTVRKQRSYYKQVDEKVVQMYEPKTDILDQIRQMTPTVGILTNIMITPDMAEDILTLNIVRDKKRNRPIYRDLEEGYTNKMKVKKWKFIGGVVKISRKMTLLDGQHTLTAIWKSGMSQKMHIQCGLEPDSFDVMDIGRRRSGGDSLAAAGFKNANVLAAAIRAEIYLREKNNVGEKVSSKRVSNQDMMEWVKAHDIALMESCVEHAMHFLHVKGSFLAQSTWAFLYYMFSRKSKSQASAFMDALALGSELKGSSVRKLRNTLTSLRKNKRSRSRRLMDLKVRYIIAVWNNYRNKTIVRNFDVDINQKIERIK